MVKDTVDGPTPAGGVRSEIYYFDEDYNAIAKAKAKRVIIREIGKNGDLIHETFGNIGST